MTRHDDDGLSGPPSYVRMFSRLRGMESSERLALSGLTVAGSVGIVAALITIDWVIGKLVDIAAVLGPALRWLMGAF